MRQSAVKILNKQRIAAVPFDEMMYHVRVLLRLKGGCSKEEIRNQFRNVKGSVVEAFLVEAMRRGIVKEDFGTYTFQKVEAPA